MMPNISMEGAMEGFGLVALEASMCVAIVFASIIKGIVEPFKERRMICCCRLWIN